MSFFRPVQVRRMACLGLIGCVLPTLVVAAAEPPATPAGPPLTLAEALQRTETRHPLFASYRAQLDAAEGRMQQARVRPAPELGLQIENALGTGDLAGLSGTETTLSFSQLIERGGLRDRRIDTAQADRQRRVTEGDIARLELRAEVARRFVHLLSDQAQQVITREATALARDTYKEVQRRVDAARAPQVELSRAQVSLARAEIEEEHAEHELLASRRHLAAATGRMTPDFGSAQGDLMDLPQVAEFEVLLTHLQQSPDVLQFASEARLRASELRLAQARRTPGLTLGAGIRRSEIGDDMGLVLSASLPLFGAAQQRGNVAEAEARIAQVGPDREQALLKAQAQLYALWQELNHARTEVEIQRARVVPAVEAELEQTRQAFARGRYSLLELRDAQAEWAAQRRHLIEAAARYHGYLIEIQRLTGAPAPGLNTHESSQP
jgi:outer membrane protein, heavy metal efflux system